MITLKLIQRLARLYNHLSTDSNLRYCDYVAMASRDLHDDLSSCLEFIVNNEHYLKLASKFKTFIANKPKRNIMCYDTKGHYYAYFKYFHENNVLNFYAGKGLSDIVYEFDLNNRNAAIHDRCVKILNNVLNQALTYIN